MSRHLVVTLLTASLALNVGNAVARGGKGQPAQAGVSIEQAAERVRRDHGGRILSADRAARGGRPMYVFKVLTPNGRVRKVWVDPGRRGGRR